MNTLKALTCSLIVLLFSCKNPNAKEEKKTDSTFNKNITTGYLTSLLENAADEDYIDKKLRSFNFEKHTDSTYKSKETLLDKPRYWIDLGEAMVSLSTVDEENWKKIKDELKDFFNSEIEEENTTAYRYLGKGYMFETYEPKNGTNILLDEYYQIFVFNGKEDD